MQEQTQEIRAETMKALKNVVQDFFEKDKQIQGVASVFSYTELSRLQNVIDHSFDGVFDGVAALNQKCQEQRALGVR